MNKIKAIVLFIISAGLTYVLYRLISKEAGQIGPAEIDNLGDLLPLIVAWLVYLCSIINIFLYIALFFAWKAFFKEINKCLSDSDTKTGVDDYYNARDSYSMWDSRSDMFDSWND